MYDYYYYRSDSIFSDVFKLWDMRYGRGAVSVCVCYCYTFWYLTRVVSMNEPFGDIYSKVLFNIIWSNKTDEDEKRNKAKMTVDFNDYFWVSAVTLTVCQCCLGCVNKHIHFISFIWTCIVRAAFGLIALTFALRGPCAAPTTSRFSIGFVRNQCNGSDHEQ